MRTRATVEREAKSTVEPLVPEQEGVLIPSTALESRRARQRQENGFQAHSLVFVSSFPLSSYTQHPIPDTRLQPGQQLRFLLGELFVGNQSDVQQFLELLHFQNHIFVPFAVARAKWSGRVLGPQPA